MQETEGLKVPWIEAQEWPLGTEAAFGLHGAVSEVESIDRTFCVVHTLLALHDLALGNEVWGFRM